MPLSSIIFIFVQVAFAAMILPVGLQARSMFLKAGDRLQPLLDMILAFVYLVLFSSFYWFVAVALAPVFNLSATDWYSPAMVGIDGLVKMLVGWRVFRRWQETVGQ